MSRSINRRRAEALLTGLSEGELRAVARGDSAIALPANAEIIAS